MTMKLIILPVEIQFFRFSSVGFGEFCPLDVKSDDDSGDLCLPTPTRIDPFFGGGVDS